MIKFILTFVLLTTIIALAIQAVRNLSGKERWNLTKTLAYSAGCAILASVVLTGFVILF